MRHLNDQNSPPRTGRIGNYRSRLCRPVVGPPAGADRKDIKYKGCLYGPVSPPQQIGIAGDLATQGLKEQTELARQSWQKWQVITAEQKVTQTADAHPYCRLDSRDWLTHCLDIIEGHIQQETDTLPTPGTQLVFDSRPPALPKGAMLQHFKGVEIKAVQPCFSPDTAILMDFRCDQSRGIHFIYLLPYSYRGISRIHHAFP